MRPPIRNRCWTGRGKDAVYLAFEQGWHGVFAPDEKLHVIIRSPEGLATQQRYISSLRLHDRVLLIYGERRQSFYDLLISRVHSHPTFALHAALAKRWQEEITHAFYEYRRRLCGSMTSLHRAVYRSLSSATSESFRPGHERLASRRTAFQSITTDPNPPSYRHKNGTRRRAIDLYCLGVGIFAG